MNKMKLQPEQAVMAVVLLLFGVGMAFLALSLPAKEEIQATTVGKAPEKIPFEKFEAISGQLKTPLMIGEINKKQPVFVSRLIVYEPASGEIGPLDENKEIAGVGITAAWLIANRLSIEDTEVGNQDPDGDGFSNLEEYKGKTNPQDKKNHPGVIVKLAVKKFTPIPFKLEFKGRTRGASGLQFQLAFKGSSKLLKEGDEIEGYKITAYREKMTKKFNPNTKIEENIDESELDLTYLKLNEVITLVLRKATESDESTVEFVLRVPGGKVDPAIVKRGDTFKVREKTYQLVKASAEGALIRDLEDANKENTIAVPVVK